MPDIVPGSSVYGLDFPPTQYDQDWTTQANITTTTYVTGSPELGVNFTAPTSGRVLVCLGAGIRNNAATTERAVVTFLLYEDNSSGPLLVSASAYNGIISCGIAQSQEYRYVGSFKMQEGLTPGRGYYCQVVHRSINGAGTVDIASRDITVIPMP